LRGRVSRSNIFITSLTDGGNIIFSDASIGGGAGFTNYDTNGEIDGGPVLVEMVKTLNEGELPQFAGSFCINQIVASRASSKKGKKESKPELEKMSHG